jgi:hypothetical protein
LLLQLLYFGGAVVDICKSLAVGRLARTKCILHQLHLCLQGLAGGFMPASHQQSPGLVVVFDFLMLMMGRGGASIPMV